MGAGGSISYRRVKIHLIRERARYPDVSSYTGAVWIWMLRTVPAQIRTQEANRRLSDTTRENSQSVLRGRSCATLWRRRDGGNGFLAGGCGESHDRQ